MYGIKTCGIKSYLNVFKELGFEMEVDERKMTIGYDVKNRVTIRKMESPFRGMDPHYQVYSTVNKIQYCFFGNEENTVIHLARILQSFIADTYIEANLDTFILDIRNLVRYTYSFFKNHIEKLPLIAYDRDVRDSVRLNEFTTYSIEEDGLTINILSPHNTPYGFIVTRGTKKIKFDDTKEYESFLRFKYLFEERGIDSENFDTEGLDDKYTLLQINLMKEVFKYHD